MYYEHTFSLIHNFKWSLSAFENLLPWERDIYIAKLEKQLEEEKQEMKEPGAALKCHNNNDEGHQPMKTI